MTTGFALDTSGTPMISAMFILPIHRIAILPYGKEYDRSKLAKGQLGRILRMHGKRGTSRHSEAGSRGLERVEKNFTHNS
jgi:hypothetical protein